MKESSPSISNLLARNVRAISKAITLNESTIEAHNSLFDQLLSELPQPEHPATIVAITGIPGVGKSTFIENLGLYLHHIGHKIAVLAIDPSSQTSHGSILGDKTRMERLSRLDHVYIRPSPSSNVLGGVGISTHRNIELLEKIGFDVILIETVGVGQSETIAKHLCDLMLLLAMPSSGDELQGVKRGIMEMADAIVVHKADGALKSRAQLMAKELESALHYSRHSAIDTPIWIYSSAESNDISPIWTGICEWINTKKQRGEWLLNRNNQKMYWLEYEWLQYLMEYLEKTYRPSLNELKQEVAEGKSYSRQQIKRRIFPN